jgi:hypothetical protein
MSEARCFRFDKGSEGEWWIISEWPSSNTWEQASESWKTILDAAESKYISRLITT